MKKTFVNLHTHSFYSILESPISPKKLLEKSKNFGCPAVALTDTGNAHGLIDFWENAEKLGNIKPIVGAEIFVAEGSRFEQRAGIDGREGKLVLIAKNTEGWHNLIKILSISALEGFYENPRADWEILGKHNQGLIALTGELDGLLGKNLNDFGEKKTDEVFAKIKNIFPEIFCEIIAKKGNKFKNFNNYVLDLAQKSNTKIIVSSNAKYLEKEDEESADTLYCVGKGFLVADNSREKILADSHFKSWEEMAEILSYLDDDILEKARENSLEIAKNIDFKIEFNKKLLPKFSLEKGISPSEKLRKNCEKNIDFLYQESIKNQEVLPNGEKISKKIITERLDYELSVIGKMDFEEYFLIVQDLIDFAKKNQIAVGPGRGSAAGSIVSYLLGITTIDPLKYELLFERFLNPERISMPDIDIDFSDERRDEVWQYVIEKYGNEKVSKVCTFGTLSAKSALKDVGRARGVDFSQMNSLTKLLPNTPGLKLEDALKIIDFKTKIEADSQLKKVFEISRKIEGCIRHVSVHACAVIIGKEDLTKETPLQLASGTENVKITQFPYQQLEHIGLLKMDFLGLKNLSVIEKTLENILQNTGQKIDMQKIIIDDKKVFSMMAKGETTGVFQFESDGMRRYLRELKPTEFEDLVAMNALYRPGPMEYIPDYIKGKHNSKSIKYLHPDLESILHKTYGIAVYQEQILKIAQVFAGFSLGQADILRKAIGKKISSILTEQRSKFIEGALKKGNDKKLAIKIFDEIIVPFSGYGFNRSHAVCYARIAYETAYLRANFPTEFMSAMMTMDRNNTDRIVLEMHECQAMGINVSPPNVNKSDSFFSATQKEKPLNNNFYIVRHGESENNVLKIDSSSLETAEKHPLTKNGQAQVENSAQNFKNKNHKLDLIITSPFLRTRETAQIFAKHFDCEVIKDEKIAEINLGIMDGKPYADFDKMENSMRSIEDNFSEGESIKDVVERIKNFFSETEEKYSGKNILLVSHGLPTQIILRNFAKKPQGFWQDNQDGIYNAEIHKITNIEKQIVFGLTAIKGLGDETAEKIIRERDKNGDFQSIQNFAERIPQKLMNKKTLEALAFSGALDIFGNRKSIVESLTDLAKFSKEFQEKRDGGQVGLFGGEGGSVGFKLENKVATSKEILNWERESLGIFVSDHPLKGLNNYFEKFGTLIKNILEMIENIEDTKKEKSKKNIKIHGIVVNSRKIITKTGKNMAVLVVEDTSGKIDVAVFPQIFAKIDEKIIQVDSFIKIEGKAESRDGKMNFIANIIKQGDLDKVKEIHLNKPENLDKENNEPKEIKTPSNIREKLMIEIPKNVTEEQNDDLKKLLLTNKTEKEGTSVFIKVDKKEIPISFKINFSTQLESKITEIFREKEIKSKIEDKGEFVF